MKFVKNLRSTQKSIYSIIFRPEKNYYEVDYGGKLLGQVYTDNGEEIFKLDNGHKINIDGYEYKETEQIEILHTDNLNKNSLHRLDVREMIQINELPFGIFNIDIDDYGSTIFREFNSSMNTPKIIQSKHNLKEKVLNFFNNPNTLRKNKKGFLLFGEPGNGKTTEIFSLFELTKIEKFRIFIVSGDYKLSKLERIKSLLENDKTIFIIEEITERTKMRGTEELLTFLDGENSWNNSVTIATTNFPKELPANLVDRPGRFDTFLEYKNPTKEEILQLAKEFNIEDDKVTCLFGKDMSFDYVSFILSEASVQQKDPILVQKEEQQKRKLISDTFKSKIGLYDE